MRIAVAALVVSALGLGCATAERTMMAERFDIVVYGGTSSGVVAAVQAARMGKSVVLIEPGSHLGGLTSGGLGQTDVGKPETVGGVALEFYERVRKHYSDPGNWKHDTWDEWKARRSWGTKLYGDAMFKFEPRVAEDIFMNMLSEAQVTVVKGERLDLDGGVALERGRISSICMESGAEYAGEVFLDCTYEGDLMAEAGVSYFVGREANSEYGERYNGIYLKSDHRQHQFPDGISPYKVAGDPASGPLPGILPGPPGKVGDGDKRLQAYCFRLCLTDVEENRVPFSKPPGYDPADYELLRRLIAAGVDSNLGNSQPMPNRKTDTNNSGPFSADFIGQNYEYPEAGYVERARIIRAHRDYQMGLFHFLANDPGLPQRIRDKYSRWGLAADEFVDNDHWPHQMYVREARRMKGEFVVTELEVLGKNDAGECVGLGGYTVDSHNAIRYVDRNGHVRNGGDVGVKVKDPYVISYKALVPKREECLNLLVPVSVSCTHTAYGSIRMEPVFMILGQSAATAAVFAIDSGCAVQDVDYGKLRERLLSDGQRLR
ncbi:MAG: FAD-dependent oxidoreductase [Planctomycetota bacterium]|jgi:hypothetical protein